jgi:feruloyl esterase
MADTDLGFEWAKVSWNKGNITRGLPKFAPLGLPPHCLIDAQVVTAPGSDIRVVYRLPENWNGKVYGIGGGGWAGDIAQFSAQAPLTRGFATMQTDAGRPSPVLSGPDVYDNTWLAHDPQAATDFSHRAIHQMTVIGKQVAAAYYGRPPARARFVGCSTGGRMALMEAQRYPQDYDEIVAGSPVYTTQHMTTA